MKKRSFRKIIGLVLITILTLGGWINIFKYEAYAERSGLTVSPMNQSIVLKPGDSYEATFVISNPVTSSGEVYYELDVDAFYLNDESNAVFESIGNSNEMVDWISFISPKEGKLEPNETRNVIFRIDVPETAPAGGQYASVVVIIKSGNGDDTETSIGSSGKSQAMIKEVQRIGHLIYAEIAGNTVKGGEIMDANVPSFLLSGNITASSLIHNTGNVHGVARYKLQIFPLFSDEEIYSNEEKPATQIIFPDRTVYKEIIWEETPAVGVFNVLYTVEFEDATAEVRKMVIKCPIWLLFIIIFAIIAAIIWLVMRARGRKESKSEDEKGEEKSE